MTKARDIASGKFQTVDIDDGELNVQTNYPNIKFVRDWDVSGGAASMYVHLGALLNGTQVTPNILYANTETDGTSHDMGFLQDGVARFKVTKEGYVIKPHTPSFYAHCSNGSSNNFKTNGAHVCSTTDFTGVTLYNNVGNHFDASNGRFTAPVAGTYHFAGGATPQNSAGNPRGYFEFLKNGASGLGVHAYYYNQNYNGSAGSLCVTLAAGDYVQARAVGTNGVSTSIYRMHFTGHLIG